MKSYPHKQYQNPFNLTEPLLKNNKKEARAVKSTLAPDTKEL